jgi:hypothetical protein
MMPTNRLVLIAIGGILTAAICFGAAVGVGGGSVLNHLGDISNFDFDNWDQPRCAADGNHEKATRQIPWDGGDRVEVSMPTEVHYQMGQGTELEITGPAGIVSQVRLRDGKVTLRCRRSYDMDITLPGRAFREMVFHGAGDVDLKGIDQPDLKLTMMGAGELKASGKTDRLSMTVMGVGDVHMGELEVNTLNLTMMGAGDAEVSAVDRLKVTSMGAGSVTLKREPREIESHIMGAGEIIHAAPETPEAPAAPEAPKAPAKKI